MKLYPLNGYVVIRRTPNAEKSAGGILLAPTKDQPAEGTIIAVSDEESVAPDEHFPAVREGQRVLFSRYAGTDLTVEGETVLLIKVSELMAVVEAERKEAPACQECGSLCELIIKSDHHGGLKTVCSDRTGCHQRQNARQDS